MIQMQAFTDLLAVIAVLLPAFLLSLSWHEYAHARVATWLGDDTPRLLGRLTLNPFAHIDPLGLLFLFIFRIGWARPVVFDHRNFRYPQFYSILTALAGPCANFIGALVCLYTLKYFPGYLFPEAFTLSFRQIVQTTASVNIMLGTFNLLPIPPLDGSHVLTVYLSKYSPRLLVAIYRYSFFFLLLIFLLPQTRMMLVYLIDLVEHALHALVI